MVALVCDICGGKLTMGAGGIAVCDSCGMEHTKERMQEKVQEIKGTVRVDNSHMTESWMKMGLAAAQAGNNKEAYEYFTKVVEIEPDNWRAIFEKGKAAAWQSTLANLRTSEMYQGIQMALEIINSNKMTDEELIDIKNEFAVALFNINNAITDLMQNNLNDIDDKYFDSHWDDMWNTRQRAIQNVEQLEDALTLISDLRDELSKKNVIEFKKRMCSDLQFACESIQYWTDYSQSSLSYLGFSSNEKQCYIDKFWKLAEEIRLVEPNFATEKYSQPDPFNAGFESDRSDRILSYWKDKSEELKKKKEQLEADKRYKEYWESHSEEKKSFEEEKKSLNSQILEIKKEADSITDDGKISNLNEKISEFKSQISSLGFFKGKEKKQLQGQIDSLYQEVRLIQSRIQEKRDEILKNTEPLKKRISKIDKELTRSR